MRSSPSIRMLAGAVLLVADLTAAHRSHVQPLAERSLASDLLHDIEGAVDCAGCYTVITALKGLADLGTTTFVDVLSEVCTLSGADDPDVCAGTIGSEGPALAEDVKAIHIGSDTSDQFCITLLGVCSYPDVRPYQVQFPKPKPNGTRPGVSGKTPLQVAHISDTHVDLSYTTGASYNCTKPICCRPYTGADAPGNNSYPAGPYGDTHCDPPLSLEESMFSEIEKLKPSFSIFTGDVPAHDIWLVNETEVQQDLNKTYQAMHGLDLVYAAIGNHDTAPINLFPPLGLNSSANPQWAYDDLASDWTSWIGAAAASEADKFGAYSVVYPGGKLRVISFNSILYYIDNFLMYAQDPMEFDPSGQLAWIVSELQAAEDAGQRAWLIAHVPMGSSDFFRDYSAYMDQIVNRYEYTIAASFFGHTHIDQFELAYSDYLNPSAQNAVAMSYIAPSMTPTSGSPSFRLYSVDPETFSVLDYTQYYANITSPTYQTGPTWEKLYSAKEQYGSLLTPPVTDPTVEMTPAFWHNVTELFVANDTVFQEYYGLQSRNFNTSACTGDCKNTTICGLRAAQSQFNCAVPVPGIHFGKRDGVGGVVPDHSAREECEGTRVTHIFKAMVRNQRFSELLDESIQRRR